MTGNKTEGMEFAEQQLQRHGWKRGTARAADLPGPRTEGTWMTEQGRVLVVSSTREASLGSKRGWIWLSRHPDAAVTELGLPRVADRSLGLVQKAPCSLHTHSMDGEFGWGEVWGVQGGVQLRRFQGWRLRRPACSTAISWLRWGSCWVSGACPFPGWWRTDLLWSRLEKQRPVTWETGVLDSAPALTLPPLRFAGKGLGKKENGIAEAIKVKVKCDTAGVSE